MQDKDLTVLLYEVKSYGSVMEDIGRVKDKSNISIENLEFLLNKSNNLYIDIVKEIERLYINTKVPKTGRAFGITVEELYREKIEALKEARIDLFSLSSFGKDIEKALTTKELEKGIEKLEIETSLLESILKTSMEKIRKEELGGDY